MTLPFEIANSKQKNGLRHNLNMQINYPMKWPDMFILTTCGIPPQKEDTMYGIAN